MKRLFPFVVATGLLLATPVVGFAQSDPTSLAPAQGATAKSGRAVVEEGILVDLAALPQARASSISLLNPPHPRGGISEEEYNKRKAEAARSANFANPTGVVGAAPSLPQAGVQTPGASPVFPGLQQQGGILPSDMALAVSPTWVVQAVNSQITVLSKTGVTQAGFPKALGGAGGFFPGATTDIGDPRAFYDWRYNRFVIVADDFTGGRMWLAASQTSDPRGLWRTYSFAPWGAANCRNAAMNCPDFPMIGFDDDTIYLSLNFFPSTGGVSDWVLLLPRAKIYAGQGFGFNFFFDLSWGGILVDTVQPVTQLRPGEHPRAGFAINSFNINFGGGQCRLGCNGLLVWAFSNTLQATGSPGPVISAVSVPTATNYRLPARANQPGRAASIDTGDTRISGSPTYHAGLISAALNTNGSDARSHVLWFQVRPFLNDGAATCTGTFANKCAQVIGAEMANEDCYFCAGQGAAGATYFGAVQPNDAGDLTMVFVYSDNNIFPLSAYVSRRVTQAKNVMHDNGIGLCGNSSLWTGDRWGDYSAVAGDTSSSIFNSMWFSAMNSTPGGHWGACIGKNSFTAINQP